MAGVSQAVPHGWRDLAKVPPTGAPSPFADWRRFDYVLVLGPPPPAQSAPTGLSLVRAGAETSLYRNLR
jgi:hypothetical protein